MNADQPGDDPRDHVFFVVDEDVVRKRKSLARGFVAEPPMGVGGVEDGAAAPTLPSPERERESA